VLEGRDKEVQQREKKVAEREKVPERREKSVAVREKSARSVDVLPHRLHCWRITNAGRGACDSNRWVTYTRLRT